MVSQNIVKLVSVDFITLVSYLWSLAWSTLEFRFSTDMVYIPTVNFKRNCSRTKTILENDVVDVTSTLLSRDVK